MLPPGEVVGVVGKVEVVAAHVEVKVKLDLKLCACDESTSFTVQSDD